MLGKFLTFLAWAGLYRVPLEVLNTRNVAPNNFTLTAAQMTDVPATFMEKLLETFASPDGRKVAYGSLEESPFYTSDFQEFRSLLQAIDPSKMDELQRKSFFINLYNILTIDALLSMESLPESTISVTKFWSRYAYKIGPYTMHLDEMEHGILRGNRPHPTTSTIMFESNDPRLALAVAPDNRIHAVLNCGAESCPPLRAYTSNNLDSKLDSALKEFCNQGIVNVDGAVVINSIFKWFSSDFASTEELTLKFLSKCVDDANKSKSLLEAAEGKRSYSFDYKWNLNAM